VDDAQWVFLNGEVFRFEIERAGSRRRRSAASHGSLTAPMPATVRRIEAQMGQPVRRGDILIVLEAMKMELPVRAPADGTIARVNCREGELVQAGQELVELQP
jgi:biotin carboxyl carrier protein